MSKKVLLGMSGGVDSSVSAILLKEQGYDVIGIELNLINSVSEDAKNICNKLNIPYIYVDCKNEFKNYVIDDFIECYKKCLTPNPCIECNKYIKFGILWKKAQELGCDYIATGHYAKTEYSEKYKKVVLKKSNNTNKDQSYVLWNIPQNLLEHIIFPLANYDNKENIRKIAENYTLDVAQKPDSEDICFIPDGNYSNFLENNSDLKPKIGNIVLKDGTVLGKHNGLYNYTIGQRKKLGIAYKEPLYVISFEKEKNEVIVGVKEDIYKTEMYVKNLNWLAFDKLDTKLHISVKTRYSSNEYKANIEMLDDNTLKVIFDEPVPRITPGQSAVFYDEDIVLGGGKIFK